MRTSKGVPVSLLLAVPYGQSIDTPDPRTPT